MSFWKKDEPVERPKTEYRGFSLAWKYAHWPDPNGNSSDLIHYTATDGNKTIHSMGISPGSFDPSDFKILRSQQESYVIGQIDCYLEYNKFKSANLEDVGLR